MPRLNYSDLLAELEKLSKGEHNVNLEPFVKGECARSAGQLAEVVDRVVMRFESESRGHEQTIQELKKRCKELRREIGLLRTRFKERARALKKANTLLESLSTTDPLTGISNRRSFDSQLKSETDRSKRYKTPLSCIMFDIDFFKKVNDTYGHTYGDEVLREIGKILRTSLRKHDIFARYGGEEFVILLPGTKKRDSYKAAEKLRELISKRAVTRDKISTKVTVSLGVAEYDPSVMIHENQLVDAADKALYEAKRSGRNRSVLFK